MPEHYVERKQTGVNIGLSFGGRRMAAAAAAALVTIALVYY